MKERCCKTLPTPKYAGLSSLVPENSAFFTFTLFIIHTCRCFGNVRKDVREQKWMNELVGAPESVRSEEEGCFWDKTSHRRGIDSLIWEFLDVDFYFVLVDSSLPNSKNASLFSIRFLRPFQVIIIIDYRTKSRSFLLERSEWWLTFSIFKTKVGNCQTHEKTEFSSSTTPNFPV